MEMKPLFVDTGQVLFKPGDPSDSLYQWVYGSLSLVRADTTETICSQGKRLGFVEPRQFFSGKPYSKTLRANSSSMVIIYASESKEAVIRSFPQLVIGLLSEEEEEGS